VRIDASGFIQKMMGTGCWLSDAASIGSSTVAHNPANQATDNTLASIFIVTSSYSQFYQLAATIVLDGLPPGNLRNDTAQEMPNEAMANNRLTTAGFLLQLLLGAFAHAEVLPNEPVEIGTAPQFLFDRFIIDNHWAIKYKTETVRRVFHQPVKYEQNPVIAGEGGHICVLKDEGDGLFRMWYQTWIASPVKGESGQYATAYAESQDGVSWTLPKLGFHEWKGSKDNNIVWTGLDGKQGRQVFFLNLPERDRRGYRYVILYRGTDGSHLIGSQDGIHWDKESDTVITRMHSDTYNAVVYDPCRNEYVMFCRAKHIYRTFRGDVLDTGASRRVARMASKELWTEWQSEPQNILIPDELDADNGDFNFLYGMPTRYHAGIYWGFLWPFKMNSDIHTELAWSRDGFHFDRLPSRPKLIERGPEGTWDDGMVFGSPFWVEVGDEWWIYYAGWDGPHGTKERTPGIGLAKLRKEGFTSMRGPANGGVLCTRRLVWPGGNLVINADAHEGELRVRVSDERRKVISGFDYDDCVTFHGNDVAHEISWQDSSIESLTGKVIRLEILLKNADIYTFRATGDST
jgi:hypothetical protein